MENIKINDDVIKLIKLVAAHPKALDVWIDASVKRFAILGKKDLNVDKDHLRSVFTSSSFLKQFVGVFNKLFSEDEISSLIEIYSTSVMQKMHKHSPELWEPLYIAMNEYIDKEFIIKI